MDICDGELLDQFERTDKVFVGLAGKSADDVNADSTVRDAIADTVDETRELPGPISPLHSCQDGVAAALERNVKMPRELW